MLLQGAVEPAHLDNYAELLRKLNETLGPACWPFIYQADVRNRFEEFERIRRRIMQSVSAVSSGIPMPQEFAAFDVDRPWNLVFQMCLPGSCRDADRFWSEECEKKCYLWLTNLRTSGQIMDDGTCIGLPSREGQRSSHLGQSRAGAPKVIQAPRGLQEPRARTNTGRGSDGLLTHDKHGFEICRKYEAGECAAWPASCPQSRAHSCRQCGGPGHTTSDCWSGGSSRGRGRGKNGGSGRGKDKNGGSGRGRGRHGGSDGGSGKGGRGYNQSR
jgi:hypothetical protein